MSIVSIANTGWARSALLWARALAAKVKRVACSSVVKIRLLLSRIPAPIGAAAGLAVAATSRGYKAVVRAAATTVSYVVGGLRMVTRAAVRGIAGLIRLVAFPVGIVSHAASVNVQRFANKAESAATNRVDSLFCKVDRALLIATSAVTSNTASKIARSGIATISAATIANVATNGAVAAKLAAVPAVGAKLAMLMSGPIAVLAAIGVAVGAGVFVALKRRHEVTQEITNMIVGDLASTNSSAETVVEVDATVSADANNVTVVSGETLPDDAAQAAANAATAAEYADITGEPIEPIRADIIAALREDGVTPKGKGGKYSESQIETKKKEMIDSFNAAMNAARSQA